MISVELNSHFCMDVLFYKNTSEWLLLYILKWTQQMPAGINLFRVNIEKLEQGVKIISKLTIKTPEQQN